MGTQRPCTIIVDNAGEPGDCFGPRHVTNAAIECCLHVLQKNNWFDPPPDFLTPVEELESTKSLGLGATKSLRLKATKSLGLEATRSLGLEATESLGL